MVSAYTRAPLGMLLPFVTAYPCITLLQDAPVGLILPLSIHCPVQKVATPQYVTTKLGISLPAYLMTEVCHNVAVEPHLQHLSGEAMVNGSSINQNGARLDVAADGFWGSRFERSIFCFLT